MTATTLTNRARNDTFFARPPVLDRVLGHPLAYVATVAILLALYGWTFVADSGRVAPTKDPAYYTWRTEVLLSEEPVKLIQIEGAFDMFAGGYRVSAAVMGAFLRQVAGVASLQMTVLLMVGLPVLTSLLLAAFAYQHFRDPLAWHLVAFATGALLLTPPFVGYLDNLLTLFFLAAALPLLTLARRSWAAGITLCGLLVLTGFTHPTTLVIFCLTLGAMAVVSLIAGRGNLRAVIRADGPMLLAAFVSAVLTLGIWTAGIWGQPASLSAAALPPPYDSAFFLERLRGWVAAMNPVLNGPLFLIGVVGLVVMARKAAQGDLTRISIVWLAPLAGVFGFLAGLTYPYYRFFNTTLSWVLLVGIGAYFVARAALGAGDGGGAGRLIAVAGMGLVIAVIAYNFKTGFDVSGWNKPQGGWLSADERADLDTLQAGLEGTDEDRPVVFVIDDEPSPQIWGHTKLSGNTSRYGLPPGQIDQAYLYLGSLENYLAGKPTTTGDATYDRVSPALLDDAREGIRSSGRSPIVVVASTFNPAGANAEVASGEAEGPDTGDTEVWYLHDGRLTSSGSQLPGEAAGEAAAAGGVSGVLHLLRVLGGLALLILPGVFLLRWCWPGASWAEGIAMAPALGLSLVTLAGIAALAAVRGPFSGTVAAASLAGATVLAAVLGTVAAGRASARP